MRLHLGSPKKIIKYCLLKTCSLLAAAAVLPPAHLRRAVQAEGPLRLLQVDQGHPHHQLKPQP